MAPAYPVEESARPKKVHASWPAPGKVDATSVADQYNAEIKAAVDTLVAKGIEQPKLVGFLANGDNAAEMYARMTKRACEKNGVCFELRRPERLDLEKAVVHANSDPAVHGILVYYPVFGGGMDTYLRDVISYEKDVEGLNHRYCYALYHNIRYLEGIGGAASGEKKCVLPCTPLACIKVLESLGAYDKAEPVGQQLRGRTAMVYNRSEVVGRPLAAMLANDGATVFSVDEHGMLVYRAGAVAGTIKVEETEVKQEDALRMADIVVSGVPVKSFQIAASNMRPGAIAINVSQFMNFGPDVDTKCTLVPAMGKVTIAMLARNLIRLHANFRVPDEPSSPLRRLTAAATAKPAATAVMAAAALALCATVVAVRRR